MLALAVVVVMASPTVTVTKWADHADGLVFADDGLPATDGEQVAFRHESSVGFQGLTQSVVIKDLGDVKRTEHVILARDDFGGPDTKLDRKRFEQRLARANAALAARPFQPMLVVRRQGEDLLRGEGLDIVWQEPRLTVKRDGKVVLDRAFRAWQLKAKGCAQQRSRADAAAFTKDRRLLVVKIYYVGSHDCTGSIGEDWHVLALP
jgi:hypothetical protein